MEALLQLSYLQGNGFLLRIGFGICMQEIFLTKIKKQEECLLERELALEKYGWLLVWVNQIYSEVGLQMLKLSEGWCHIQSKVWEGPHFLLSG